MAATAFVSVGGAITAPSAAQAAFSQSSFQAPWICNDTWSGHTRTNHGRINGSRGGSYAIDFDRDRNDGDGDIGAPVYSSASGTVTVSRYSDTAGNYVIIHHGNGWATRYHHLRYQSPMKVGQLVGKGYLVGYVGRTGNATAGHLHYEQVSGATGPEYGNGTTQRAMFNGVYVNITPTSGYQDIKSYNCDSGGCLASDSSTTHTMSAREEAVPC